MDEKHIKILHETIQKTYDLAFGKCFSFNDRENIIKTKKLVAIFDVLSDENNNLKYVSMGFYPIIYNPKIMCLKLIKDCINPYITPEELIEYLLQLDISS